MKICFIASSGGHLNQLLRLKPLMDQYDSYIVTEKTEYAVIPDTGRDVYYLEPINRSEWAFILKFLHLIWQSDRLIRKERPDVVIATGALLCVPTCVWAHLFGKKVVFIESFARITSPTLSGRLVYPFADLFIIQWESLSRYFPNAVYGGCIY